MKPLLPVSFSLSFLVSFAQKDIPAFGKVDKADLEMKESAFDLLNEQFVFKKK